jgi:hypothetical protein
MGHLVRKGVVRTGPVRTTAGGRSTSRPFAAQAPRPSICGLNSSKSPARS